MSATRDFQSQIASIMEVLANAAVAEICKVVDDGYAVVHLEMSQSHKENEFLRRKIKLLELQIAKFRAEKMKFSDGSISSRFGVRLINRHSLTPASGPSLQSKVRPVNRNTGINTVIDRSPINVNQDAASNCGAAPNNKSTEPKEEEEDLDLLIVKVEGAVGVDDTALSRDSVRPLEGSREISLPTTTKERDVSNATQPASNAIGHNLTEVSGSHTPAVADNLSETKIESVTPLYAPTGSDLRAEIPYMDLNEAPLAQEWTNVATNNISYTTVMDIDSQPGSRVSTTEQSIGHSSTRARMSAEGPVTGVNNTEQRPEDGECVNETHTFSQQNGNRDNDVHSHLEVKSEVIIIDPLPIEEDDVNNDNVTPSSSWSPSNSGRWELQGGGDSNTLHLGNQGGIFHSLPSQSSADERLYGVSRAYDARFQNNLAASAAMSPGDQLQQLPPWSGFQENGASLLSQLGDITSQGTNPNAARGEPRPYKCAFCLRQYPHLCQLRIHERVHTGEKPYQCAQCGKQFGQFCSLKRHQRVHTGEKPYRCAQCGKQFSHSNNLKVHQSVHTGEKRFHCTQCGKNFSFLSNLIRHQTVHAAGK